MKKLLLLLMLWLALPVVVQAAPNSSLDLEIEQKACSLDQVSSGAQTTLQVSPEDCLPPTGPEAPALPIEQLVLAPQNIPDQFLQLTNLPVQTPATPASSKEVEAKNTIWPMNEIKTAGQVVVNNPGYTTAGLAFSVPFVFVADTFLWNGRIRKVMSLIRARLMKF